MFSIKKIFTHKKTYVQKLRELGCIIGDNAEIHPNADFGSEPYLITIGNHVRINTGVKLVTHDGGVWVLRHLDESLKNIDLFGEIHICDNVHIGTNAIIMPGVTVGENSIVGCGAVVTKNVPANTIVAGVPAKIIESLSEYKEKHILDFVHTKHLSYKEKEVFLKKKYRK